MRSRSEPVAGLSPLGIMTIALTVTNLLSLLGTSPAAFAESGSEESIQRGKRVFERSNCSGCHPGGNNSLMPSKPIKGSKFQEKYKDDSLIEQVVRHGFPSAGMPPFSKAIISQKDMKDLVAYVRSLTPKDQDKSDANH